MTASDSDYRRILIVFGKNPIPGTVKTRLTTRISEEDAADLYRAFLLDALDHYAQLDLDIRLYLAASSEPLDARVAKHTGSPRLQSGDGLGARMYNAFCDVLEHGALAVIVGTDHVGIPISVVASAYDVMQRDKQAVPIGPSRDGGYYLLGMRHPQKELFDGMTYSTSTVFQETVDRIRNSGGLPFVLPNWFDVDTPDDLRYLVSKINSVLGHERTRRVLAHLTRKYPDLG